MTVEEMKDAYTLKEPIKCGDKCDDAHVVYLNVGVQRFRIDGHQESAEHAEWMRKMLAVALLRLVEEQAGTR